MSIASPSENVTATGATTGVRVIGDANLTISGTFVASCTLQRSFDDGSTWHNVAKNVDGDAATYTAPVSVSFFEPEEGVLYRVNVTYTSGTVTVRISR